MILSEKLVWKIKRLRLMSGAEILYRFGQSIQGRMEALGLNRAVTGVSAGKQSRIWCECLPVGFADVQPYTSAADAVLAGRFDVFALRDAELGFPPKWNRDYQTSTVAPMTFGRTLNYRDEGLVGNIKYLWELNRHLELVTLAQAWHLTSDMKYAEGCRTLLESWFEQCPYPLGPNWTSSLEHAVRLVNWSFAWHLLGGEVSVLFTDSAGMAFRQRWLDMIYRHCHFIAGHFSKYSSANNHLLGEHMGLFVGSLTWPLWRECDGWRDTALKGFESEALRQNTTDGVNREQAVWYHHEVADMMLICGLLGRANGKEFSDDYWTRLEAMLDFIVAIMDAGGNLPMIGDSDDAVMVRFSREADFSPYHSLLATGAVLFQRCDFKARAGHFDDKSRWLLGDLAKEQFAGLPQTQEPEPHRRAFPEGGYYVLGHAWQSASEIRIVADAGPLGYLSIAAHAHADALAFTLSAGGREFLIDPGTFAYHTHKKWRDYFRSTSAHNTVRVDGLDQSVGGGNFMWLQHASATVRAWEASDRRDRLVACHNGYLRLPDPVLHTREILLEKDTGEISVRDTLTCKHKHRIELFWHCHEDAKVWLTDSGVTVAREARRLEIAISDLRFVPRLARGEETPPLGWVSRCFDVKQATTTIVWSGEIEGVTSIESKLTLHFY